MNQVFSNEEAADEMVSLSGANTDAGSAAMSHSNKSLTPAGQECYLLLSSLCPFLQTHWPKRIIQLKDRVWLVFGTGVGDYYHCTDLTHTQQIGMGNNAENLMPSVIYGTRTKAQQGACTNTNYWANKKVAFCSRTATHAIQNYMGGSDLLSAKPVVGASEQLTRRITTLQQNLRERYGYDDLCFGCMMQCDKTVTLNPFSDCPAIKVVNKNVAQAMDWIVTTYWFTNYTEAPGKHTHLRGIIDNPSAPRVTMDYVANPISTHMPEQFFCDCDVHMCISTGRTEAHSQTTTRRRRSDWKSPGTKKLRVMEHNSAQCSESKPKRGSNSYYYNYPPLQIFHFDGLTLLRREQLIKQQRAMNTFHPNIQYRAEQINKVHNFIHNNPSLLNDMAIAYSPEDGKWWLKMVSEVDMDAFRCIRNNRSDAFLSHLPQETQLYDRTGQYVDLVGALQTMRNKIRAEVRTMNIRDEDSGWTLTQGPCPHVKEDDEELQSYSCLVKGLPKYDTPGIAVRRKYALPYNETDYGHCDTSILKQKYTGPENEWINVAPDWRRQTHLCFVPCYCEENQHWRRNARPTTLGIAFSLLGEAGYDLTASDIYEWFCSLPLLAAGAKRKPGSKQCQNGNWTMAR